VEARGHGAEAREAADVGDDLGDARGPREARDAVDEGVEAA
jgi:hypothetical protein